MLMRSLIVVAVALLAACAKESRQAGTDPVTVAPEQYKVLLENDRVRVLGVRFQPGEKAAMHSHPDYVVYGLGSGNVKFTSPDGKSTEAAIEPGAAVWTEAETHASENVGTSELHVLLVELKG